MFGNEDLPNDVLEYVVFERLLTNFYSKWRITGKIVPEGTSKSPLVSTLRKEEEEENERIEILKKK